MYRKLSNECISVYHFSKAPAYTHTDRKWSALTMYSTTSFGVSGGIEEEVDDGVGVVLEGALVLEGGPSSITQSGSCSSAQTPTELQAAKIASSEYWNTPQAEAAGG